MHSFNIANIKINTNNIDNEYFHHRLKEYSTEYSPDCDIRINIQNNCNDIKIPEGKIIANVNQRHWMELSNGQFGFFDRFPEGTQILSLITSDKTWSNIDVKLCSASVIGLIEDVRPYNALGEILKFAILKYDGIVLHSSCIDYNGNGIAFSGPSGTGKSTHTSLWKEYYPNDTTVINDDMPIVRFIDDIPYVFGTPWSGKTEINCNIYSPLKGIVFLHQSKECSIKAIGGSEVIWRLLNETRKPALNEMMDLSLNMLDRILQKVPTYLLSCDISREAVELAKTILDNN